MAFELVSYPDADALARSVAGQWLDELPAKLEQKEPTRAYCVALSGGRIAQTFFSEIARQAAARSVSLTRVHFFWADERCVPPTDPESNFAIARELLFEPLNIPASQVHRLQGEVEEAMALRQVVEEITELAAPGDKGLPALDMVFLGMGEDGHVASLFPGESADVMASPAIYRAVTAVKPPPRRMTLGYGMLAAALDVWVLASGKGKEQALKESLSPAGKTPLARVLRSRAKTKIVTELKIGG